MEIIAFGVQTDERPLMERAFADRHQIRCLDVNLDRDTAPIAHGYEIVTTDVNSELSAEVLQTLFVGGTKLIAQRATGYNNIDLQAAADLGMTVGRVAAYSPYAVAEFAWALALAVDRRVIRAAQRTRLFDFRLDGLMGRDLRGRTVGVVGTGRIGEAFTRIAHGFGMRLLGWDLVENPACCDLGLRYVDRDHLFAESDLITLHVPLTDTTRRLVDAAALAAMKDDVLLVNTSRGGLVDTAALVETLKSGRLSGVALDVYEEEAGMFFHDRSLDVVRDDVLARLMTFGNVLVTSHQAYFTADAVGQIIDATLTNVEDYLAGRGGANLLVTPGRPPAAER
ncbi:2-hydroxyacid dehydrogenase [Streptomyces benahoarensis]|uniref:2-hydroxyacid dehydrogenase n=1 Tax=Streptomyces benahoarensis TaxID=2595054 RepID=A0A553ZJK7_9ACTN|nr:2-hydroxyacid dehydrogenase [Streptomyces benahoarensis]TSB21699.1 2-hydroxyacid dehydrogenase [Streptomyces benahoarensis]TSB41526.1 2-hydroxyacid dehydrogenase [Streptomyces benahoarensis]